MKEKTESDNENLADAFKRGVDYSKRFRAFKEEVREEKNWGLRVRVTAILLTLVVGAIVGLVALSLLSLVEFFNNFWKPNIVTDFAQVEFSWNIYLGISLLVSALIAGQLLKLISDGRPRGPADLILSAQRNEPPEIRNGFLSATVAMISLSGGSSVGMFGPLMHFGGCFSYFVKKNIKLVTKLPLEVILGSGAAAAIAAVFSAPIGAAIFAHEAILRHFSARAAAPISISAISASAFSAWLFGGDRILAMSAVPEDILPHLPILLLAGIVFALVAILIMKMNFWCIAHQNRLSSLPRGIIVVVMLALLGTFLPEVLGLGLDTLKHIISQDFVLMAVLLLFCFKFLAVLLSVYGGFVGGYFSPALYLGAAAGSLLNGLYSAIGIGLSGPLLIVSGMAAVSACVIGAPVAVVVLVLELTMSYNFAVGAMICVVTASFIAHLAYGHS